jgi:hypothetical protein
MNRQAHARFPLDFDGDRFAIAAEVRTLRGDMQRIKELAHGSLRLLSKHAHLSLIPSLLNGSACRSLRKADIDQGAVLAMGCGLGRRRFPGIVKATHFNCQQFSADAQSGGELNLHATARLAIKDGAARHVAVEHFFEANRLGAELDEVAVGGLTDAALVLHREGPGAKFDHVGTTRETKTATGQQETTHGAEIVAANLAGKVGTLVQQPALRSEPVFYPCLLEMNQSPLPRTKGQML